MKSKALNTFNLNASSIQIVLASIDPELSSITKEVIVKLFYSVKEVNLSWLEPRIITKGNNVNLEWWENGKFFALYITPNGSIEFVKARGSENPSQKWESNTLIELEVGQQPSEKRLISVWRWLTA